MCPRGIYGEIISMFRTDRKKSQERQAKRPKYDEDDHEEPDHRCRLSLSLNEEFLLPQYPRASG